EIYPDYKANRPPPPEELIPQFDLIREATRAFNVPCVELAGYEADDLIATYARLARERGQEVTIVSSDKDLMQLVGEGVAMLDPVKNQAIGRDQVIERFGVAPEKVIDVQALAGDSTDNVPGVPGIGVKTAAQLIEAYGDLETVLDRAGEIKQPKRRQNLIEFAEQARVSRELVTLKRDVPIEVPLEALRLHAPDPETVRAFLEENGFRTVIARLSDLLGEAGAAPGAAAAPEPGEADYELVQDLAALQAWIVAATEQGSVAVDTETTSLDALSADLVGVSLALAPGKACYIPLGHRAPAGDGGLDLGGLDLEGAAQAPRQIPLDAALAALKPLLEDPGVLKIGQNLKYDELVLSRHGIAIAPLDDTMLLSYVLDGGRHGHGMDELARLHLGYETIKFKDVAGSGKAQVTFDQVPLDKALDYAAEDADVTWRLHALLKPRLVPERMTTVYETLERPLVPVLTEMERAGIKVDRDELRRLSNDFAGRIASFETEIHGLAGRAFNIGSPKQLGEILFDELGLPGGKRTKSGAYATGADILDGLAAQGHELPARVLDWRQLAKLKSTYTDALQERINPETGRVHTSFSQAVASTGRLASTDPNLQNIPIRTEEGRKIRRAFVAEDGHSLLSVDYSQIELRLTAHIAEVAALRQAFLDGQDIHAITASQVFGVPIEGMDPMVRRQAKAINFGIIYGISPFGLANNLGISQGEAKAYIEAYFERYPGIRDYMEKAKAFCREHGFVETLFGRRVHMPAIADKNPARRGFTERAAINAPIQGTAADIIKRAMIRVPPALARANLRARMLLQVHDELLFEVPEAELDETTQVVKAVMETACAPALELSVPLVADAGHGPNWAEAH
ncbi:MAG: DNA polymerase I, partial [Proteobacteria bacterium]|nr:DNA polymerase I [Pseudomonadota bacterium]